MFIVACPDLVYTLHVQTLKSVWTCFVAFYNDFGIQISQNIDRRVGSGVITNISPLNMFPLYFHPQNFIQIVRLLCTPFVRSMSISLDPEIFSGFSCIFIGTQNFVKYLMRILVPLRVKVAI